jgi:hypothetical protein
MKVTIDLDPPLNIPGLGRAEIEGSFDLEFVTVRVWDRDEKCIANGKYMRVDPSGNRYKLISGNSYREEGI